MPLAIIYVAVASITFVIGARLNRGEPENFGNTIFYSVVWPIAIPITIGVLVLLAIEGTLRLIYDKLSFVPQKSIEMINAEKELENLLEEK